MTSVWISYDSIIESPAGSANKWSANRFCKMPRGPVADAAPFSIGFSVYVLVLNWTIVGRITSSTRGSTVRNCGETGRDETREDGAVFDLNPLPRNGDTRPFNVDVGLATLV